ncbi:hypothetical protein C4553_02680 [Candidatus Parcubacteria bacterium]|nr:MAG: hypothetical protein C4553_02680 [Candidatus Parcubacteria bacterium]
MITYKKGVAPIIILLIALGLLAGGATFYVKQRGKSLQAPGQEVAMEKKEDAMMKKNQVVVVMNEQNNSGQTGTAVLTDIDGQKTKVTLVVSTGAVGVAQPAHIHIGSCPTPGAVKYPLNNVVNGRSETTLDISLLKLGDELPSAINVHKSASEVSTYVSCGDLPMQQFEALDAESMMMKKEGDSMMNKESGAMMEKGKTHTVEMTAAGFIPSTLMIKKGDAVQFTNRGTKERWPATGLHPTHEVYPGSDIDKCGTSEQSKIFDACMGIAPGASWSFTFNEVGSWGYHDHLQSLVRGQIVVQ